MGMRRPGHMHVAWLHVHVRVHVAWLQVHVHVR